MTIYIKSLSKTAQAGRYARKKEKPVNRPESELQAAATGKRGIYKAMGIDVWHLPENSRVLPGFPDCDGHIKISEMFTLGQAIELKTKSQLHGAQVHKAHDLAYTVARDEAALVALLCAFKKQAEKCKKCLQRC